MLKKKISLFMICAITIFTLIPFMNVNAEDANIIRQTTINYFTTVKFSGTLYDETTDKTLTFTRTSDEITGNTTADDVTAIINQFKNEFNAWADENNATTKTIDEGTVTDYYYDAHDEITQCGEGSTDTVCVPASGSNVIQVGDPNDIMGYANQGQILINTVLNKHQTYTINAHAIIKDTTAKYLEGANQKYTSGSKNGATFKLNPDYNYFETDGQVYVDDVLLSKNNYTSKRSSTSITLLSSYLNTLSAGQHTLKVEFNDGRTATTTFTIVKPTTNATTSNPQTGDNILLSVGLLIISIIGFSSLAIINRKKLVTILIRK